MRMQRQQFLLFRVYRFQDTKAYSELYDLYVARMRRYIFFKVPKPEDADELTAEVFLRGWEYATSSQVDYPGALFYKIARNVIADFYRRRQEEASLEEVKELPDLNRPSLAEQVDQKSEAEALLSKLKLLKEEYRDVLVMRYLDEMSIKEIALATERDQINVRVLLHRARAALKSLVD
jgi:RNA polymerase sigma-70 factor (ECF subfamily)